MASQNPPVALVIRVTLIGPVAAGADEDVGAGAADDVAGVGAADDDVATAGALDAPADAFFLLLHPAINTAIVARTAIALYRDDTVCSFCWGFLPAHRRAAGAIG
jgi:hypothetical protein